MSYIIRTYNGTQLAIVADGTVDITTDLSLVGRNYSGYGIPQNENFLYLLENFANITPPSKPLAGQLWFDKDSNKLKFYDINSEWRTANGADISSTRPNYLTPGDFWFDGTENVLYVYSLTGSTNKTPGYIRIGPLESSTSGDTSKFGLVSVKDTDGGDHNIFEAILEGTTIFTVSKDAEFTLSSTTPIAGFETINTGITMISDNKSKVWGTSLTSENMAVLVDETYINYPPALSKVADTVALRDSTGTIFANINGISTKADTVKVGSDYFSATTSMLSSGNKTSIVARDTNGDFTANLITATATQARYADLAEKYLSDSEYDVGTVMMVGGDKEVTASKLGSRAIGVISENPAYMMNSELVDGVYIALKGRVPVKVIGPVAKGSRLIAGDDGTARVPGISFDNVFAIALETSTDDGIKIIEAIIL
jgi:hypothetical protein